MSYTPQEGIDYIVDLYAVAAVEPDAESAAVKRALNERALEYHPDRLEGLAPEFRAKGERMARLLNRARAVLLDDDKRSEYDTILTEWQGPTSNDGTPVIRMDDSIRAEMALKTPEEIEAVFSTQREQVVGMVKHNPKQQAMLSRMLESAEGDDADELREAYDSALFAEDQVLAIEEADRGRLLGLTHDKRYETSLGYAETVQAAIEGARATQSEEHQRRMLGGVSVRLALLAGESADSAPGAKIVATSTELPHYFDDQAKKVADIASKREELLTKRLEIFQPTYPNAEIQTEAHANFVIGIKAAQDGRILTWIGFHFDSENIDLSNVDVPEEVMELLSTEQYEKVYNNGFNVLTFALKDQIEMKTLLDEAYNKHLQKFFPGILG